MSRLYFSGMLNNGRRGLGIIGEGVEPDKEAKLGSFVTIAAGRQLTDKDHDGILLGQGAALSLGLKPGDTATLVISTGDGAMNILDFTVAGVFQSFSKDFDVRAVRIPLAAAPEFLATPGANLLVVLSGHAKARHPPAHSHVDIFYKNTKANIYFYLKSID